MSKRSKGDKVYIKREYLQELIRVSGRTLQDIANDADIERPRISELLNGSNGNPRLSTLFPLAAALGVRPGDLVADEAETVAAAA